MRGGAWQLIERWGWLPLLLVATAFCAQPEIAIDDFVDETRRCFASVEQERGPVLPDCPAVAAIPSRADELPWMRRRAELLREEMAARWATVRYLDAGIGLPDRAAQTERLDDLAAAARGVLDGSGRLSLDLLGPRIPLPSVGRLALSVGARSTLLDEKRRWRLHDVQQAALAAALLEGDRAKAYRFAKRYAESPSEETRLRVAALMCLQGDAKGGMEIASAIEQRRADKRTANFHEDFGEARVLIEACAGLAGIVEPEAPGYGYAGDWNHRARLVLFRMRSLTAACAGQGADAPCSEAEELAATVAHAREMLASGWPHAYRLELLAVVAPSLESASRAGELARPLPDEPTVAARVPLWPEAWLTRASDAPMASPELLLRGADALDALVGSSHGEASDDVALSAAALRLEAGVELALRGDVERGTRLAEAAAKRVHGEQVGRAGAALALLLAGEVERARAAAREGLSAHAELLRAELALPDRDAAIGYARHALAAANAVGDVRTTERARWLLVALGDPAAVPQSGAPRPRVPDLGPANLPISPQARAADVADTLATWSVWLGGSSEQRRAARYALFHHRDVFPPSLTAYACAAGRLVDEPEQVETWLDVAMARLAPRVGLRTYAFVRWRAARWRRDNEASALWRKRFDELAARTSDSGEAELWQTLGL